MKVFLSSAAGFQNGAILERLLKLGHTVVALDISGMALTDQRFTAVNPKSADEWLTVLLGCDAIIYDLHTAIGCVYRTINALIRASSEKWGKSTPKVVVGLSSLLTWGGDSSQPLHAEKYESEWRKRVPIASHIEFRAAEDLILLSNSPRLRTVVIGAGILYGNGEDLLGHWFKAAWMNPSADIDMPVWDSHDGHNKLPMIHVQDLCSIVLATLASHSQEDTGADAAADISPISATNHLPGKYVVAVDAAQSSLRDVLEAISKEAASGKLCTMSRQQLETIAFCGDPTSALASSSFQVDLSFAASRSQESGTHTLQAALIMQTAGTTWQFRDGFVAHIGRITASYRSFHKLLPLRIAILGSPASGKTELAKALSSRLHLSYYDNRSVIIAAAQSHVSTELTEELKQILTSTGRRKEGLDLKVSFKSRVSTGLKRRLTVASMMANIAPQVQGWVLDGAVSSRKEAQDFFLVSPDAKAQPLELLKPDIVLVLDGADEVLMANGAKIASDRVVPGYNDDAGLKKRLNSFREHSIYVEPPSNEHVSEVEAFPGVIAGSKKGGAKTAKAPVKEREAEHEEEIVRGKGHLGGPFFTQKVRCRLLQNLDMSHMASEEVMARVFADVIPLYEASRPAAFRHEVGPEDTRGAPSRPKSIAGSETKTADGDLLGGDDGKESLTGVVAASNASNHLDNVAIAERAMLKERCKPLTRYLMEKVIPALTNGTLEMCKARPDDPLEFLASWLEDNSSEKKQERRSRSGSRSGSSGRRT